jgi:two-component system sensor histidine kinase HydH
VARFVLWHPQDVDLSSYDIRTRTTLVCGVMALVIGISAVLRGGRLRRANWFFAGFAWCIGLSYLAQTLFGFFHVAIWERARVMLAVLMPVFCVNLFEAMVPDEDADKRRSRIGRWSVLVWVPFAMLALSPYLSFAPVRISIFLYSVIVVTIGLYEMGQRGLHSRSRATQRRVRFLVVTGALAGLFIVADFAWVIGWEPAYHPPPVGVVLSVVFLFMLAQPLKHERLMDLSEMLGRLLVATAVAFLIAFIFYLLVTVIGQFNTMWLNAILVAIVVLVLFNPLRDWVEKQIHRFVFRDAGRLRASLAIARRRLAHTLAVEELGDVVMNSLERSRAVTTAALYLVTNDGAVFEQLAQLGPGAPARIEAATANALLEQLARGSVRMEEIARMLTDDDPAVASANAEAVMAASEVLGELRDAAVVVAIRAVVRVLVGLLVVADARIGDAFSPEDVVLLEQTAAQIGVVVENSRVYSKMKEKDRLAVLGQMAAGLAHEIRNPLGAIKGAAQLLADPDADQTLDESSREFIGIIIEEVDRLDEVVGSVLDLARENTDVVTPIDINAAVRRTLQVMGPDWADMSLCIDTELEEELPRASIAPDQLRQVMMNLLRNAAQAMHGTGTIVLRTRTRQRVASRWEGTSDGPAQVAISVTDDGPGISRAALKNIFLPFFTTKEEGTGLGLAICQRIVQSHGGRIEVSSREGVGTTFDVVLPAIMDALGTPTPAGATRESITDVVSTKQDLAEGELTAADG